jgi:hypothetical protein
MDIDAMATNRLSQIALLASTMIASVAVPAQASGDPMAALLILVGGPLLQIVEGIVFAAIVRRALSGDASLAILAYTLGCLASWGLFLSRSGLELLERLAGVLAATPDAVNGLVDIVFWILVVLVGPASAAVAILVGRGIRKLRSSAA